MRKRVAIVGAGIAGLSAGVYASANGYDVDIFESHTMPGGLCTAWHRNGYTFDGCVHWLSGSGPLSPFHQLWNEVGALAGREFVHPVSLSTLTTADGRRISLYADVDRLEQHLVALSPGDAQPAHELCSLVRDFKRAHTRMDKAFELFGPLDIARMIFDTFPVRKAFSTCSNTSCKELAARFQDPAVRAVLQQAIHPAGSLVALVSTLADLSNRSAAYPLGGSLPIARAIEKRCLESGARIHYRSRVRRVLVRAGTVVGVELEDGSTIDADAVISAADLRRNLDVLLEGRFPSPVHEALFREQELFPSSTIAYFGLSHPFHQAEQTIIQEVQLARPLTFANQKIGVLRWHNYGHDPSLAPPGHSVITSFVDIPHEWWSQLGRGSKAYTDAKEELASLMKTELDRVLPGFAHAVKTVDVATPLTFERYTDNYRGSYMTWLLRKDGAPALRLIPKTLPGLKGFYMAGMWLMAPGGLPCALKTARDAVQLLCHSDRIRFQPPAHA